MAKHRAEKNPYLFGYPLSWVIREYRIKSWVRKADARHRRIDRKVRWAAFRDDVREWFGDE